MSVTNEDEKLLRRYLLGQLTEAEQEDLEQRLFSDEELFDLLNAMEDDLTDEYVNNSLSGHDRERVESHFLRAPERKQKVKISQAMQKYATNVSAAQAVARAQAPAEKVSWWQSLLASFRWRNPALAAFAAIALMLTLAAVWLALENNRLKAELARRAVPETPDQDLAEQRARAAELERKLAEEQQRRSQLEQELAAAKSAQPQPRDNEIPDAPKLTYAAVTIALMPGLLRDVDEVASVDLTKEASELRLVLGLEDDPYPSYRAEIQTEDGASIWKSGRLRAARAKAGDAVTLKVSPALFQKGIYRVVLSGSEDGNSYEKAGSYIFKVVK